MILEVTNVTRWKFKKSDTPSIGMLSCVSKYGSIKFLELFLHILTHKSQLNGLEGCKKIRQDWYKWSLYGWLMYIHIYILMEIFTTYLLNKWFYKEIKATAT